MYYSLAVGPFLTLEWFISIVSVRLDLKQALFVWLVAEYHIIYPCIFISTKTFGSRDENKGNI